MTLPISVKFLGEMLEAYRRKCTRRSGQSSSSHRRAEKANESRLSFPTTDKRNGRLLGRMLLKGFTDMGIFPVQLSFACAVAIILGEAEVTPPTILHKSFRAYRCEADRHVIDKARSGSKLNEDDNDDLIDLLSRVNRHQIQKEDEIRPILLSIAHKESIRQPKYAVDAMPSPCSDVTQCSS